MLPFGWASSIKQGLANRRINIVVNGQEKMTVESERALESVSDIDFAAIINEKPDNEDEKMMLTDFSVADCFRANGAVYVEVEGKDQIGFLAVVLRIFLSCCLFPWDFSIKTEGNYINDKFHLMGTSGSNVSLQVRNMLKVKLAELRR
jgi:UTP:GlnB (protein PII) uridylyltransferase